MLSEGGPPRLLERAVAHVLAFGGPPHFAPSVNVAVGRAYRVWGSLGGGDVNGV